MGARNFDRGSCRRLTLTAETTRSGLRITAHAIAHHNRFASFFFSSGLSAAATSLRLSDGIACAAFVEFDRSGSSQVAVGTGTSVQYPVLLRADKAVSDPAAATCAGPGAAPRENGAADDDDDGVAAPSPPALAAWIEVHSFALRAYSS